MISGSEPFVTLGRMGECTVARGVGASKVTADNWQLRECELGYGSRNNRSDQPELQSESHGAIFCSGTGGTAFGREKKGTDGRERRFSFVRQRRRERVLVCKPFPTHPSWNPSPLSVFERRNRCKGRPTGCG